VPRSKFEYVFKVNLKTAKRIWRIIALAGYHTLEDLHEAIFTAFDRDDEHLYSFYFPRAPRSRRPASERVREYTASFVLEDPGPLDDDTQLDAAQARLDDLHLKVGQQFEYLFDFGDTWWHDVRVEQIRSRPSGRRLPIVVEKHGDSPPQYAPAEDE